VGRTNEYTDSDGVCRGPSTTREEEMDGWWAKEKRGPGGRAQEDRASRELSLKASRDLIQRIAVHVCSIKKSPVLQGGRALKGGQSIPFLLAASR
jgi:hypothetical protein